MWWLFRFGMIYSLATTLKQLFSFKKAQRAREDRQNGHLARNFKGRKVIDVNFTVEEEDGKGN